MLCEKQVKTEVDKLKDAGAMNSLHNFKARGSEKNTIEVDIWKLSSGYGRLRKEVCHCVGPISTLVGKNLILVRLGHGVSCYFHRPWQRCPGSLWTTWGELLLSTIRNPWLTNFTANVSHSTWFQRTTDRSANFNIVYNCECNEVSRSHCLNPRVLWQTN